MLWFPWARSGPADIASQDLARRIQNLITVVNALNVTVTNIDARVTIIEAGDPAAGFMIRPPVSIVNGRHEVPGWGWLVSVGATPTLGVIYFIPIRVTVASSYDQLAINVQTPQAGTSIDVRLYNDLAGVPGSLRIGTVNISTAAGGAATAAWVNTLPVGNYWLAVRSTGAVAPTLFGGGETDGVTAPCGGGSPNDGGARGRSYVGTVTSVYTDPAPALTAVTVNRFAGMVQLRRA